jgi:exodeoxyribonuclease VII large subunit
MQGRIQHVNQRLDHLAHRLQQRHPAARLADQARRLQALKATLQGNVRRLLETRALRLDTLTQRLATRRPERTLAALGERVGAARRSLDRLALEAVRARRQRLRELARTLHAVSPLEVIGRGYAVITAAVTGSVVSSVAQLKQGDRLEARLADGSLLCTVDSIREGSRN